MAKEPREAKRARKGAANLLAASPLLEGAGCRYCVDCNGTEVVDRRSGTLHGVARYAVDPDNARRLWALS
ncbi:short-chain dehydrogenase [Streptomyces olivaceoviridis]|uniref:short-chain dehydrogenase n=1 Tax=Streptomyces olivaceoviridis TaxID=1921 RepID=UPI0036A319A6